MPTSVSPPALVAQAWLARVLPSLQAASGAAKILLEAAPASTASASRWTFAMGAEVEVTLDFGADEGD